MSKDHESNGDHRTWRDTLHGITTAPAFTEDRVRAMTDDQLIIDSAMELTRIVYRGGADELTAVQAGIEYAERMVEIKTTLEGRPKKRPQLRLVHSAPRKAAPGPYFDPGPKGAA